MATATKVSGGFTVGKVVCNLTSDQVATQIGYNRRIVQTAIKAGEFGPTVKVGHCFLVSQEGVAAFLKAREGKDKTGPKKKAS